MSNMEKEEEEPLSLLASSASSNNNSSSNKKRKKVATPTPAAEAAEKIFDPNTTTTTTTITSTSTDDDLTTLESAKQALVEAEKRVTEIKSLIKRLEEENKNRNNQSDEDLKNEKEEQATHIVGNPKSDCVDDDDDNECNYKNNMLIMISTLPHVLEWLQPKDVFTCVQVCKQFQSEIDGNHNIWKQTISNLVPSLIDDMEKGCTMGQPSKDNINKKKLDDDNSSSQLVAAAASSEAKLEGTKKEGESKSQNRTVIIDYKMVAKGLVYKPLLLPQTRCCVATVENYCIPPNNVFVIVEAKLRSTGEVIGYWKQNFCNYIYGPETARQRNLGIDMFAKNEEDYNTTPPNTTGEQQQQQQQRNDVIYFHTHPFQKEGSEVIIDARNIRKDIEYTVRLVRCDNSKSLCFTSGQSDNIQLLYAFDGCAYVSDVRRPVLCKAKEHDEMGMHVKIHTVIDTRIHTSSSVLRRPSVNYEDLVPYVGMKFLRSFDGGYYIGCIDREPEILNDEDFQEILCWHATYEDDDEEELSLEDLKKCKIIEEDDDDDDIDNNHNESNNNNQIMRQIQMSYGMTKLSLTFHVQTERNIFRIVNDRHGVSHKDWPNLFHALDNLAWK